MRSRWQRCALVVLVPTVIAVGCAKRPQLSTVAAPAPTGAAVTQAPTAPPPTPPPAEPLSSPAPVVARPEPATPLPPPAPALPPPAQFREDAALRAIHFDFDKFDIRPDAARILDGNIDWMKSHPKAAILIEGHCDERGTNEYNIALGDRRAKATMSYLTARGVPAGRITMISYGEERPVCTVHSEACWAQNRRAQFLTKAQ